MLARLFRVVILICFVFSAKDAFAATTHYISKSLGSDSNNGTAKSTPWAHLPGMNGCTATCGSYNPGPGDQFILYGGDNWTSADLGVNWTWGGTGSSPIYVGVDQTWYNSGACGTSWCRPIFNCGNTAVGSTQYGSIIWVAGNYVIFDNIEVTGYQQQSGGGDVVSVYSNNDTVKNFYIHGFSRTSGSGGSNSFALANNWSGGGGVGTVFDHNVIDGSDSPNKDFMGGILHGDIVQDNVIRYVYNGMNGEFNDVHGNLIEYNYIATSGDHCNMLFFQDLFTATVGYVYNNVIRHSGCSGGSTLWLLGNANCTSCTMYAYNNVIYDVAGDFDPVDIPIGNHPGNSGGPFYIYNNTLEAGGNDAIGNGECCQRFTTYYSNNHFINIANACLNTGTVCANKGTNLIQTAAQASTNTSPHYDQYTSSETYAYSPTASTNSTVGTGTNYASMCSGGLAALCNDTTYPTYSTSNHTVVMRSVSARGSVWDIGAYQFATSQAQPPDGASSLQSSIR